MPSQMDDAATATVSRSREETLRLGIELSSQLAAGDVVLLRGTLGSGKTVFAAGIAQGLGSSTWRGSPTFSLVNEYETQPHLYHVDLYRLSSSETDEFGLEEYGRLDSILVCEWPERAESLLRSMARRGLVCVEFEHVGDESRKITVHRVADRTST